MQLKMFLSPNLSDSSKLFKSDSLLLYDLFKTITSIFVLGRKTERCLFECNSHWNTQTMLEQWSQWSPVWTLLWWPGEVNLTERSINPRQSWSLVQSDWGGGWTSYSPRKEDLDWLEFPRAGEILSWTLEGKDLSPAETSWRLSQPRGNTGMWGDDNKNKRQSFNFQGWAGSWEQTVLRRSWNFAMSLHQGESSVILYELKMKSWS